MENQEKIENMNEKRTIYEVGFLIDPSFSEDEVATPVAHIKELFEMRGGEFISQGAPHKQLLAYTITTSRDGKKSHFDQAYFGWVKYEIATEEITTIKDALDSNTDLVRFIIVKASKEEFTPFSQVKQKKAPVTPSAPADDTNEPISISKEELDKTIEELVIE